MAYRRKGKKSSKTRLISNNAPPMKKGSSVPLERQTVDWPGNVEDKYVEDIKNRLNVIEQNCVSVGGGDDMIRAFLAANDMRARDAVEALKKTVEWRKGRQMFWNNYRSQNERYQFLQQIRKCGRGIASTYGHTKNGRLVFYEKLGENFSIPLHKEFSVSEFIDHVIVWCENLLNAAFANAGKPIHLINQIPYYNDEQEENENKQNNNEFETNDLPITPIENEYNGFPDTTNNMASKPNPIAMKHRFKKLDIENKCRFSDVVGIIDWDCINSDIFLENKDLLIACAHLLSTYYPHLINRLYHINMPLNFDKIENELKKSSISSQILYKSIFLESTETKQKRIDYMKKYGKKPSIRKNNRYKPKKYNKTDDNSINLNVGPYIDEYSSNELLTQISSSLLPKEYGGQCEFSTIYTFVDSLYKSLVGMSSEYNNESESYVASQYEEYNLIKNKELALWKQDALRSAERRTVRQSVKRGEHYTWEYMAEYNRELFFGLTFETDGFRGKSIKIIVRNENKQKCGYCPMFGDFIVLKDGNLIFQFRNIKGAKRLNLQYKIQKKLFPKHFINKHLPDYHAEERLLQSNTLNIGGKKHYHRNKKTASEYSGSTAISTSPPPEVNINSLLVTKSNETQNKNRDDSYYKEKMKRAKSQRNKKSIKTKKKSKKLSKSKRAKTPEPHTPI